MIGKFCFAIPHHTPAVNIGDETKKAFHPSSLTPGVRHFFARCSERGRP
jgi:hypothetical protein